MLIKHCYSNLTMPINAGYEYVNAEKAYLEAKTPDDKIRCLEEMIRTAPKHKGSENLVAGLRLRMKKFKEAQEKNKKVGKSSHQSVKKEGFQVALLGPPNSGKSSLLAALTNAKPKISENPFTTYAPELGTMNHLGVKAQIVDLPSIGSESFDMGIINTADLIILVLESLSELASISSLLSRSTGKRLIVISKSDLFTEEKMRKLQETVKSKKLNAVIVSSIFGDNINLLKEKIFLSMNAIRVYTKEPGKSPSNQPILLPENSMVKVAAEAIYKGFSAKIRETRITGPSSKFSNQKVGLSHILKDKDIVEFHT